MICVASQSKPCSVPEWHDHFLAMLPTIVSQARFAFRGFPADLRQELVAEVVGYAVVAYARLVELDKLDLAYPSVLARYGIAQIRAERHVGSPTNRRDVYSRRAQHKKGFRLERLDRQGLESSEWQEAVVEDCRTPVPDQAAFRVDFPRWLSKLPARQQRIALSLAVGERATDVSRRFGVTPGRISQLRRAFFESWQAFHGELEQQPSDPDEKAARNATIRNAAAGRR